MAATKISEKEQASLSKQPSILKMSSFNYGKA